MHTQAEEKIQSDLLYETNMASKSSSAHQHKIESWALNWFTNAMSKSPVLFKPSPCPAGAGMCSNTLFTYPAQETSGHHIGTGGRRQQTSAQCVNTCSSGWLSDIDCSVYTSAQSQLGLIIVYTVMKWTKQRRLLIICLRHLQQMLRSSGT